MRKEKNAMSEIERNVVAFAKLHPDAILPSKRPEDVGYDVYALNRETDVIIQPHETVVIRTGIASVFHPSKACYLMERGSTGTKGLGQRSGVIDSGYRGEWMVPITNHNDRPVLLTGNPGKIKHAETRFAHVYPLSKAITQAVFCDLPQLDVREISPQELLGYESERGDGKLGSSGK